MSNPLLDKYFELHPEKKEKPENLKHAKDAKVEFFFKEEFVEELEKIQSQPSVTIPYTSQNSVATGGIGITKSSFPKLTTYDTDSANDAFFQVAQKIKDGKAKVSNVSIELDAYGNFICGKKITFEVYDYEL
jgi:hypothetical protein